MKLSVLTVVLYHKTFEETLKYLSERGVQAVEVGTGGSPGNTHMNPDELLADEAKIQHVKDLLKKYNMEISALSCHDNGVHPNAQIAQAAYDTFQKTVLLAEKLGVDTIVNFSGCPGDQENAKYPNWVTCSWPEDYKKILDWQWNEKLIPYWKKAAAFAEEHGIHKIALELHPGFCVYNTASLLRLREAVGPAIGANFDPSHLIWQGMDPVEAIRALKGAIYHFHAKDTYVDPRNKAINGVLDTGHYGSLMDRSWTFRTVGYGHDFIYWKNMISMLRCTGYDGAISIEHEDALMSPEEGLDKAIRFLKDVIISEQAADMWWA